MQSTALFTTNSLLALSAIAIRNAYHLAVAPVVNPANLEGELQAVFNDVWLEVIGTVAEVNAWEKVSIEVEYDDMRFQVRLFPSTSYRRERDETRFLVAARALDRSVARPTLRHG